MGPRPFVLLFLVTMTAACSETPAKPSRVAAQSVAPATTPPAIAVTIQATTAAATEAGSVGGVFAVNLSDYGAEAVVVNYRVGGTATPGSDYAALTGSLTIPAGQTSANIHVTPVDDGIPESDETVIVSLTSGTAYAVGTPESATVTISDNDATPIKCRCSSIETQFDPGGGTPSWGTYLVHGRSTWRVGFRIDVKCTGTGQSNRCSVFQIETGTLKWSVGGKAGQITGQTKKVNNFHKGKLGDPWEKEYSDALGADYPPDTTDKLSVTLDMDFEIKCVSSDGTAISKRFKIQGSVEAQAAGRGGKPALTRGTLTLTPLN